MAEKTSKRWKMEVFKAKRLLHHIKERPAIYNFDLKDYYNKAVLQILWKQIADEMESTVHECKTTWHILRCSYNRELRKAKSAKELGVKRSGRWHLFDKMKFLSNYVGGRPRGGGNSPSEHGDMVKNEDEDTFDQADSLSLSEPEQYTQMDNEDTLKQADNEDSLKQTDNEESLKQMDNEGTWKRLDNEGTWKQMDNEDTLKLLRLVEERPQIYNFNLADYNNREIIDKKWKEIAQEMNMKANECKSRWMSLRGSLNRVLRDQKTSYEKGIVKPIKWPFFDVMMHFLGDFVNSQYRRQKKHFEETQRTSFLREVLEINVDDNSDSIDPSETIYLGEPLTQDTTHSAEVKPQCSEKVVAPIEKVLDLMIEVSKSQREVESSTLTFFKSLLPEVDKLSQSRQRRFKQDVMDLLYHSLEEQENTELEFCLN
ncbi:uncharacterized protein LOC111045815 [Nilaparvata lugens]|uniref:uncharacterized protein LOC111045815 n=1 Tax=Nilaparvata lugens TaxID=108931 RepID=UPI00193D77A9|nr:uncharacterized protein LOC111045815 [Nilaparvata lugens]